ncbi:MAG TPA: alpha-mannosidase, partial [Candidatus Limiplasma sp.]|nr:alpha-mannosidase [Candidatus Limiplasma sp.]
MIDRGRQERQRVFAWMEELKNHVYTPFASVEFEGFETTELLTVKQAKAHPKTPYPTGTPWGGPWAYGWFAARLTLPQAVQGKRVVLLAGVGSEMTVYCNGQAAGSIDKEHHEVTVTACAKAGEPMDLLIECYAGHGARLEAIGPCPPDRPAIPPIPAVQCTIAPPSLAVWNETAFQLLMDVQVLGSLLQVLPDRSLRAQKVAQALLDFTRIVDFEQPKDILQQSFAQAREALAPALACHNGDTAPTMYIFGQSHIDLAWLWPVAETLRKSVRTYANQVALLKEYPEYRFMACEPALLQMLKEQNAELFAQVRRMTGTGQIEAEGAFYVECDTNIPSGESLIRQITRGKQWFKENLDADTCVGWLPDTFGFSAALPQIMKGCGINYFATQKLLRQDPECQPFPYQNFWWEGLDGTRVLAHMFFNYSGTPDPQSLYRRWYQDRVQQRDIEGMLFPFGYGDGGGGATRTVLEQQRRTTDLEGVPRTQYTRLRTFFETMPSPKNRWVGELYLAWHRGTYTAQHETKWLARRLEFALNDLEKALALLRLADKEAEIPALRQSWDTLFMAQFHDVIGGVGIRRVYQTTNAALRDALQTIQDAADTAWRKTLNIQPADAISVLNPHAWGTACWVRLPHATDGMQDAQGCALPCYTDGQASYAYANLPAMGMAVLTPCAACGQQGTVHMQRQGDAITVANEYFMITFDARGQITSLIMDGSEW